MSAATTSAETATPDRTAATEFSVALLGEFIALGVSDIVLSPGSRSQALALAAAAYEQAGAVRLRVRIDERVAGFLALGLAVETQRPVILITTSGTAVANLHPAVLEAHHSGVPLILLTADRPPELRGIGSNQTTDQITLFGSAVGWVRDVLTWDAAGGQEAPDVVSASLGASAASSAVPPAVPSTVPSVVPSVVPSTADRAAGFAAPASGSPGVIANTAAQHAREAYAASTGRLGARQVGPVQLNLAYREPLSGPVGTLPEIVRSAGAAASTPKATLIGETLIGRAPNTVVIAGHGAGSQAESFARELGVPLLAEISSGARFGPNLVSAYRQMLQNPSFGGRIERAIVFGHPTLSREIPALLQRNSVEVHVVQGTLFEAYNPGHRAVGVYESVGVADSVVAGSAGGDSAGAGSAVADTALGEVDASVRAARDWLGSWVHSSRALLEVPAPQSRPDLSLAREQLDVFREPVTRAMLAEAVWRTTWPHDRLVLGASRLIRIADATVPGKKISVHANRGLAGIDGTIATAIGVALASQGTETTAAAGTTRVLLGDLATLYDAGALLFGVGEVRPRIQVIVGNDGGGTIFDDLEVAGTAPETTFDRVLYTPQKVDFAALAAAYGWAYRSATNRGELDEALAATDTPTLVEVTLPR